MSLISRLASRTALLLCLGTAVQAQDPLGLSFKMGGGPINGGVRKLTGDAGFTYSATFEMDWKLSAKSAMVIDLGYRWFPGDYKNISFIPATLPSRAAVGTYYESSQVDKAEGGGFQLGAMYRVDAFTEGMYVQGGLIVGFNRLQTTSTGTRLTITVTTAPGAGTVTAVDAIKDQDTKTTTSIGPVIGLGYRFGDRYTFEANAFTSKLATSASSKSGAGIEVVFGVRF